MGSLSLLSSTVTSKRRVPFSSRFAISSANVSEFEESQ
jgi:hypothetical protein